MSTFRPTLRLIAATLAALGLLVGSSLPAAACSCALLPPRERIANADLVARGVVTAVDTSRVGQGSADPVVYTIRASVVWKGTVASTYQVSSAAQGPSCRLEGVRVGDDIVLFARAAPAQSVQEPPAPWQTNLCSGTGPAAYVVGEIAAVAGPGKSVSPEPVPHATPLPVTGRPTLITTPDASGATPTPDTQGAGASVTSFPMGATSLAVIAAVAAGAAALVLVGLRARRR